MERSNIIQATVYLPNGETQTFEASQVLACGVDPATATTFLAVKIDGTDNVTHYAGHPVKWISSPSRVHTPPSPLLG